MSYAVDAATKLHQKNIEVATKVQDLIVEAVEKLVDLREKAPKAPSAVTDKLDDLAAPMTKIFGTRTEVREYITQTAREWVELQQKFQTRLLDSYGLKKGPVAVAKPASKASA
jgi:hypothetical protein